MHDSVMDWCMATVHRHGLAGGRVLEVGSFDVNGSVRHLFAGCEYVGVDMRPGPGVDAVVTPGVVLPAGELAGGFDVVVTTEMLEHDPRPWVTVPAMAAALRPGGHLLLTTRGFGYGEHDFPSDYWRFSAAAIALLLDDARLEALEISPDPAAGSPGWFAHARRDR